MTKSSNSAARAIFPYSKEDILSFIDIDMKRAKPIATEVVRLFTETAEEVVNNTDSGELFSLVRTMHMMICDNDSLRLRCLRNEDLGGDEKRNKLAQMIDLMVYGDKKEYRSSFNNSAANESVNSFGDMLRSTKYPTILRNFTLRLIIDLVEKNHALFNGEEKLQWIEQASEEPSKLFEDFRKKDQKIRDDWAEKIARHEKTKRDEAEENDRKKSKKSSNSHENSGALSGGGIFAFGSNAAMMFPTLPISLEGSATQNFEQLNQDYQQLKISASPSSSPKNSGKRGNFAESFLDSSRSNSPQKKEESRVL